MMNIPKDQIMDDTQWQALIREVAALFNNLTIMRGFQYYKQKRVGSINFNDAQAITAEVQGSESYEVVLRMQDLSSSYCACPVNSPCKHMAAVLMSYAEQQGRPVPALVNAHASTALKQTSKPAGSTSARAYSFGDVTKQEEAIQDNSSDGYQYSEIKERATELAGMDITEWHELFRASLKRLGTGTATTAYVQEAADELYAIKPKMSVAMDQLFELHVQLYLMRYCIPPARNSITHTPVYLSYPAQLAVDALQKGIETLLLQSLDLSGLKSTALEQFWARLDETSAYLRAEMLPETANMMFFTPIYSKLWLNWIVPWLRGRQAMLESELLLLNEAEAKILSSGGAVTGTEKNARKVTLPLPLVLAQSWMYYHLEQDSSAWQKLIHGSSAYGIPPEHLLYFLHTLTDAAEWTRLSEWLVQLGPLLANRRNAPLQDYMRLWDIAIQHVPDAEHRMWDTLVSMLPHSRPAYEDAMHSRGQWRRWIDFQLSTGTEPLEFRVAVLQPIEKDAPELLLPFYHQAVERYIVHKNRDGYKAAVKLLKRLSKIYKKMKQEEPWEQFITALAVRNSRLRALQEELRKGKLIP
ncbi:SWIM zinc finger family protein [Paenibacillus sp. RRE4]|uniref:SWIM zinc finger family protein n=1 Tax=Paenibacillus sp. RRE4 TaxID=2962587 RepID=UPI0028810CAA|nr:SWIM zinc finger family protein [Paenibacillus sp. RRE4]MDT0125438.1 SWIM zinc finger family protein [Paenibacillus sp. RRE4]